MQFTSDRDRRSPECRKCRAAFLPSSSGWSGSGVDGCGVVVGLVVVASSENKDGVKIEKVGEESCKEGSDERSEGVGRGGKDVGVEGVCFGVNSLMSFFQEGL